MDVLFYIPILFFVVALLYSMVGFGGGSSYIAILLLIGYSVDELRIIALLCNITVVLFASINYYRNNLIDWKRLLPILLFSIPFAYLGARFKVDDEIYKSIAGLVLLVASLIMLFKNSVLSRSISFKNDSYILSTLGGGIGFISGFIGIGGGIFLSPVLHISKMEKPIIISGMCSVFILFNSIAGIFGHWEFLGSLNFKFTLSLIVSVFLGGLIGNQLNIKRLKPNHIKFLTAILVGYVGIRLLII